MRDVGSGLDYKFLLGTAFGWLSTLLAIRRTIRLKFQPNKGI